MPTPEALPPSAQKFSRRRLLTVASSAAFLAACGGGTETGKGPGSPLTPVERGTLPPGVATAEGFPTYEISTSTPYPSATNPESDKSNDKAAYVLDEEINSWAIDENVYFVVKYPSNWSKGTGRSGKILRWTEYRARVIKNTLGEEEKFDVNAKFACIDLTNQMLDIDSYKNRLEAEYQNYIDNGEKSDIYYIEDEEGPTISNLPSWNIRTGTPEDNDPNDITYRNIFVIIDPRGVAIEASLISYNKESLLTVEPVFEEMLKSFKLQQ